MKLPVLLLIVAAFILCTGCTTTNPPVASGSTSGETVVDAFVPLTGVGSQFGESHRAALLTAADDINRYYREIGSPATVKVIVHDTGTDPATSARLAREVREGGRMFIIGYVTSAEIAAIRNYTGANGMIVITTGSTAPSLAIPGDSVYRVVSDDTAQGKVMASWLSREKVRTVIPLWRGDIWGDGLVNATREALGRQGGVMTEGVRYDPATTDFNATVSALDAAAGRAIGTGGAGAVGIFTVTFGEIGPIAEAAASRPNLSRVRWFGTDGNTGDPKLAGTTPAARFAAGVNFSGTTWGIPATGTGDAVTARIRDRLGRGPDGMAAAIYDTLWVTVSAKEGIPAGAGPAQAARVLSQHFDTWYGVSGILAVNDAGDREVSTYDIMRVATEGSGAQWVRSAQVVSWPGGREEVYQF